MRNSRLLEPNFFINTDFRIIHEDEDLLVIDKPSPLAVHPVGCYFELNLHSLLKKDPRWAGTKIHLAHRLDAETSGVIIVAKNYEAARGVGISFRDGLVHKTYEALVFGEPAERTGEIRLPLGYDKSSGFQTVRTHDPEGGEPAATRYRVEWSGQGYSKLIVEPLTGRTHQIRAHLALIGHPIVGDKIYIDLSIFQQYVLGGLDTAMLQKIKLPRLALHAARAELRHPVTRENICFASPTPDFLSEISS